MQLIFFLLTFIVLPAIYATTGFIFGLLTIAFIVGIQPHIKRLSEEGHTIKFAVGEGRLWPLKVKLWERKEIPVPFTVKLSQKVATLLILLAAFGILPLVLYVIYWQAGIFVGRIEAQQDVITESVARSLSWARGVAPEYVPQGDSSAVFGGILTDLVGDAKHTIAEVSKEVAAIIAHITKAWFELVIAMILVGVLIGNWDKESKSLKWRIKAGISDETLRRRVFRGLELYQDSLSILIIGYVEVALTLTVYYFVVMTVLPLNLSLGFVVLLSIMFGFITAIPKIGGIITKIIAPILIILNFQDGFGYFGYAVSLGLVIDLLLKAFIVFAVAFFGGYLEAYEYTPDKIGNKLGITKMEMVMTVLIWAIGAKAMGLIWGLLIMLLIPTFTKLFNEEQAAGQIDDDTVPATFTRREST